MCLAVPGKVLEIFQPDDLPMAKVDFGGIAKEVCLAYTPEVQVGDYVIVHVGFAISQVDPREAEEIFSYLAEIERLAGEPPESPESAQSPTRPQPEANA